MNPCSFAADQPSPCGPTVADIEDMAGRAMQEHGLLAAGWTFKWDRARRRLGCCDFDRKLITLSWPVFVIEANRDDARETILHEVAHGLAGSGAGHGPKWRTAAWMVGARPERCGRVRQEPELPIVGNCACESAHQRVRMPTRGNSYSCVVCRKRIAWSRRLPVL